ncbi:MAG: alpha/beta fold hydrolase, partial [Bacteroidota bacterium]
HELLRQHLGIEQIDTLIGASLGGQQALEWAVQFPDRFRKLILIATNAQHSPWGIAFNESQRMAIRNDRSWGQINKKAGLEGMKIARSIAMLSYRGYQTYSGSQSDGDLSKTTDYRASSYQRYQGEKLAQRFNAFSYYLLSEAMDSHNVGRGRGSVEAALKSVSAKTLAIGISSDLLFPVMEQKFLASNIPDADYQEIDSDFGHDGFLVEADQLDDLIRNFEWGVTV